MIRQTTITTKRNARNTADGRGKLQNASYHKGTFYPKGRRRVSYRCVSLLFPDGVVVSEEELREIGRTEPDVAMRIMQNHTKECRDHVNKKRGREMQRKARKARQKARKQLAA